MAKISVLGAGSWGTALSLLLHNNGHEVILWSIIEDEVKMLQQKRQHESKLPGVKLPDEMEITSDLSYSVKDRDVLILAVPSPFTRSTAHSMRELVRDGQILVNVAKGIEESTLMTLSEIIEQEIPQADVAVLSGPSHAEEVGRGLPTTCVVSARSRKTAEYLPALRMVWATGITRKLRLSLVESLKLRGWAFRWVPDLRLYTGYQAWEI